MSYMKNILYISSIAKSQGAENYFEPKEISSMLIYNEMEVRLLIQTAIKYMKKSRRTRLQIEDIEEASQYLFHGDLFVSPSPRSHLNPHAWIPLTKLAESCGFTTVRNTQEGKLKAHWLYQKGKVSRESSVTMIRKLRKDELNAVKEKSYVGNPNLILFNETGRLSEEEIQYLAKIQKIMAENEPKLISSLDGNIQKLFSLYLTVIRQYPNEAGIKVLMCLVNHPLANQNLVLFQLHRILEILLVYRGKLAYQVGVVITQLVARYRPEQPALLRVMERESTDFSFLIKAIAFEEYFQTGVFHCRLKEVLNKSLKESWKGNEMAMICLNLLIKKLPKMVCFVKQLPEFPFWIPNYWSQNDKYLGF